ncbi:MAG: hypothetical protein JXQ73_02270 [Phycisphaerae bacterium]|nr:hypothetical protein [Phycisphaerae bacterium]
MKSIVHQRVVVWMMVAGMGTLPACLPNVACMSGAEQTCLDGTWFNMFSAWATEGLSDVAPRNITGNAALDALWNGGVDYALGLGNQAVDICHCRNTQNCIPDDPFPFPATSTPDCCP